jgi:hypothetical protein
MESINKEVAKTIKIAEENINEVLDQLEKRPINRFQKQLLEETYKEDITILLESDQCVFCGRDFQLLLSLGMYECPGPLFEDDWAKKIKDGSLSFNKHFSTVPIAERTHFLRKLTTKDTIGGIVSKESIKLNFALFWYFRFFYPDETENLRKNVIRLFIKRATQSHRNYVYDLQSLIDDERVNDDFDISPGSLNFNTSIFRMFVHTKTPLSAIIVSREDGLIDNAEDQLYFYVDLRESYVTYKISVTGEL